MELKSLETIILAVAGVIAIILAPFKDSIQKWSKSMMIRFISKEEPFGPAHVERERRMNNICVELRYRTDADRSYIFKFHNGEKYSLRDPLWKITCTNEVVRTGIAYTYQSCRAILVSSVIEWLMPLFGVADVTGTGWIEKENCTCEVKCDAMRNVAWYDVRSMVECSTKAFLIERGAQFVILAPLMRDNHVFGFVGLDYCTEVNQEVMLRHAEAVCQSATLIAYNMEPENAK